MSLLPNQKDVINEAGLFGWGRPLTFSLPPFLDTQTSGGGSVNPTKNGAEIQAGTTAGDTALIKGFLIGGFQSFTKAKTELLCRTGSTLPITDEMAVGWYTLPTSGNEGAYLDFKNEQYVVGSSTASASIPTQYSWVRLTIVQDFSADETTFRQVGSIDEEVTISTTNAAGGDSAIGGTISNGDSDRLDILYARQVFLP